MIKKCFLEFARQTMGKSSRHPTRRAWQAKNSFKYADASVSQQI